MMGSSEHCNSFTKLTRCQPRHRNQTVLVSRYRMAGATSMGTDSSPAKTMANKAKPTANGPMMPNEGSHTPTAYTTETITNAKRTSPPHTIPPLKAHVQPVSCDTTDESRLAFQLKALVQVPKDPLSTMCSRCLAGLLSSHVLTQCTACGLY